MVEVLLALLMSGGLIAAAERRRRKLAEAKAKAEGAKTGRSHRARR